MGCDIHAIAERRVDGRRWEAITDPVFHGWKDAPTSDPADFRNYDAFAILADVRNDPGWKPIVEPRGIPDDASSLYLESVQQWNVVGPSVVVLTPEQYDALDGQRDPAKSYHIRTSWDWFAKEAAESLHRTTEDLIAYARDNGIASDDLRLVYFFDN